MNVALDIDGTITAKPEFFAVLSKAIRANGGKVIIVTSRSNTTEVKAQTRRELRGYGIAFDELVVIADAAGDRLPCPHGDLDWYQQYLWQKVAVCVERGVTIIFEDDEKVIALFKRFAPDVQVFQLM
jgi:hypothetical protein